MDPTPRDAADAHAIQQVLWRIARAQDMLDTEGLVREFTEDCLWISHIPGIDLPPFEGQQALRAHFERQHQAQRAMGAQSRHTVANPVCLPGARETCDVHSVIVGFGAVKGEPQIAFIGAYADVFVRTEAGWKIQKREFTADVKLLIFRLLEAQAQAAGR